MQTFKFKSSYCDSPEDAVELDRFTEFIQNISGEVREIVEDDSYSDLFGTCSVIYENLDYPEVEFKVECDQFHDEDLITFVEITLDSMYYECDYRPVVMLSDEIFKLSWRKLQHG